MPRKHTCWERLSLGRKNVFKRVAQPSAQWLNVALADKAALRKSDEAAASPVAPKPASVQSVGTWTS